MEPIKFGAKVVDVLQKVSRKDASVALKAASADDMRKKPVISVTLLLAVLDVKNLNGHYLPLEEGQKMVEALAEHPNLPGNCNHDMVARATSTSLWIEEFEDSDGEKRNGLFLKGVLWNNYIDDKLWATISGDFDSGALGASWEMNIYTIDPEKGADESIVLRDFIMNGWGLILSDSQPAEGMTRGKVSLSASVDKQKFWDRHTHLLQAELELEMTGKALTYEERQALPDSDFALVRTVKDSEGNDVKERDFPIDAEERRKVVLSFLKKSKQFSTDEKVAVFKAAVSRGKKEGDEWVKKYDGYDLSVFPPKPPKEVAMGKSASRNMLPTWSWDGENLAIQLFRGLRCPECSSTWNEVKKMDYENGTAEMECGGDADGENKHRFEVAVVVKPLSQPQANVVAEYWLVEKDNEVTYIKKEMKRMPELTDEQVEEMKKQAGVDAVEAYKVKMKLGAARADEIGKLVPFESEAKRIEAMQKYSEMSDDQYLVEKKEKEFAKEKADMLAQIEELKKAKEDPPAGDPPPDPKAQVSAGITLPPDPLKTDGKPKDGEKKPVVELSYDFNF